MGGRTSILWGAALVGGIALAVALVSPRWNRATPPLLATAPPSAEAPAPPMADWCTEAFEPIPGDGCLALPSSGRPSPLVVYLHGRYSRDADTEETDRRRRLATRATARGFAVLALRGALGTCSAPELATWFCWPSNAKNADSALRFVEDWKTALETAQQRAGSPTRFILGFSNGGYFAAMIAARNLLPASAFVVAHGGPVEPMSPRGGRPPMLLLSADDDVAQDDMIRLDEELVQENWAHDSYARSGPHGLTNEDIDAALTFLSRAGERIPLDPPLPLHRPVRHSREAEDAGD